uniref:Uncharacterized protein n=1 Tax=Rhizophora mucronata TaxID=61149 RepID=A0A2P2Q595_RHIMU
MKLMPIYLKHSFCRLSPCFVVSKYSLSALLGFFFSF